MNNKCKLILLISGISMISFFGVLLHFTLRQDESVKSFEVNIRPVSVKTTQKKDDVLRYDYAKVLDYSLLFYESMRSGKLPSDNRVPWRGDSCLDCRGPGGKDLSKGYFKDGLFQNKHIFYNSITLTTLAWGLIEYKTAYETSGLLNRLRETIMWGADYIMNMRVNQTLYYITSTNNEFTRPEENHYSFNVSDREEYAFLAVAALAASSFVTREYNDTRADEYLQEAKDMFHSFALRGNDSFADLEVWSLLWLYRAETDPIKKEILKNTTRTKYDFIDFNNNLPTNEIYRPILKIGTAILCFEFLNTPQPAACFSTINKQEKFTPNGHLYLREENISLGDNIDFVAMCMQFGEVLVSKKLEENWENNPFLKVTVKQVNLFLGDNRRSFVTGFGHNPPVRAKHVASSCPLRPSPCNQSQYESPDPNPQTLYGALVRGPGANGVYTDNRTNRENDVGVASNSGFQTAVAFLYKMHLQGKLPREVYDCKISYQTDEFEVFIN